MTCTRTRPSCRAAPRRSAACPRSSRTRSTARSPQRGPRRCRASHSVVSPVTVPLAPDDVVATPAEAAAHARPPLLVLEPLAAFLDAHGLGAGAIEAVPIGEGHSNVTFRVRRGEADVIVRRPPRPPLPPSAHDMLREARVLRALEPTPVRVPRV